jgi:hypothetical protein
VSVLVSVYIIRVHCPLHHTLDTFYGLFAKKLQLHKSKIQEFLGLHSICLQVKYRKKKEKYARWICKMLWNMRHETKGASSTNDIETK